jgi:hypothetical protein
VNSLAFISYSHVDEPMCRQLCDYLERESIPYWVSFRDIPPGTKYWDVIVDAVKRSSVMVVVVSSHAMSEDSLVQNEVELAEKRIPFIPFFIEEVDLDGPLLAHLKVWQGILIDYGDQEARFQYLADSIKRIGLGLSEPHTVQPLPIESHWSEPRTPHIPSAPFWQRFALLGLKGAFIIVAIAVLGFFAAFYKRGGIIKAGNVTVSVAAPPPPKPNPGEPTVVVTTAQPATVHVVVDQPALRNGEHSEGTQGRPPNSKGYLPEEGISGQNATKRPLSVPETEVVPRAPIAMAPSPPVDAEAVEIDPLRTTVEAEGPQYSSSPAITLPVGGVIAVFGKNMPLPLIILMLLPLFEDLKPAPPHWDSTVASAGYGDWLDYKYGLHAESGIKDSFLDELPFSSNVEAVGLTSDESAILVRDRKWTSTPISTDASTVAKPIQDLDKMWQPPVFVRELATQFVMTSENVKAEPVGERNSDQAMLANSALGELKTYFVPRFYIPSWGCMFASDRGSWKAVHVMLYPGVQLDTESVENALTKNKATSAFYVHRLGAIIAKGEKEWFAITLPGTTESTSRDRDIEMLLHRLNAEPVVDAATYVENRDTVVFHRGNVKD